MQKLMQYYVSSINGNDSNDGLSPETAFLTLDKINSLTISAGDKILLQRGSVFNNQFLHLKNCGDINGEPIEIAPEKRDRTGVAVVAQNRGTLHSITLKNLFVHDVNGNVYNKHMNNGGIYMTAFKPADEGATGVARYDGVTVEGCVVKNVSRWGIAVGYTYRYAEFS